MRAPRDLATFLCGSLALKTGDVHLARYYEARRTPPAARTVHRQRRVDVLYFCPRSAEAGLRSLLRRIPPRFARVGIDVRARIETDDSHLALKFSEHLAGKVVAAWSCN